MAEQIFDATLDVDNDVKVNNFDWSHANNLTTQIGRITPIFCDLVPAKTSFRVNPRFGLQFMPMVFPIQTRMKARISFFRYPLRALWKDYKDFVGNFREGLEEPYLNINTEERLKKMASTGSLGDYLGLPTTMIGDFGKGTNLIDSRLYNSYIPGNQFGGSDSFTYLSGVPLSSMSNYQEYQSHFVTTDDVGIGNDISKLSINLSSPGSAGSTEKQSFLPFAEVVLDSSVYGEITRDSRLRFNLIFGPLVTLNSDIINAVASNLSSFVYSATEFNNPFAQLVFAGTSVDSSTNTVSVYYSFPDDVTYEGNLRLRVYFNFFNVIGRRIAGNDTAWYIERSSLGKYLFPSVPDGELKTSLSKTVSHLKSYLFSYDIASDKSAELSLSTSPWFNSESAVSNQQVKLLSYSFRAYEGIYNSYFRDNRNNPYYLNGQVQYNTWIPNDAGGIDDTLYELHYANWEKDFLTTAVQSPQQGNAPLVGITTYTQTVSNDDGTRTELVKTALVDEDGKKYGLSFKTSDEGLEGVEYLELDNGTSVRQARNLYDLATSGISIPDLRMVNCYQKFLELNMRKGYSYKAIVEGRFDVKVRYADLLLPEFFGGVSRDIDVNSVTQTVDQNALSGSSDYSTALGSQAGIAGVRGEANANIECFCDEESIIIGLLVVTPLPVYTQLLPKHFTYRGLMEHYQPEFNLIGFQPIKYNEVCPIQAFNHNPASLTDTFGYNRPWYEYAQKYDVAHGLFRTDLSNFLMHRVFDQKPELAKSFLVIDPEQVTDVFAVTETTDKIYGQIWLDITCKLPIARVAIPRLD